MKKQIISWSIFIILVILPLSATPLFSGTYSGNVVHNGSPLVYRITFKSASICSLQAVSTVDGKEITQETEGVYSYDNTFFRLNAVFRSPRIPNINTIQWVSVISFNGDTSFNILIKPDSSSDNLARIVFTKEEISFETDAITQTYNTISQNIPSGSRIAIVNIASSDADEGLYFVDELTVLFVNARKYAVVDRRSIDVILAEQNFQMSGYVDDNSAVSIGKFLGATVVITGSINGSGARKRLVLKALDVKTAEILAMSSLAI
ncbi:MAG: CsgG/HfaB family protein [Treponema sp.]|jgi:TolB-like protein|nr:CsgG/HfaB family protein [Treponema sp.]